MRTVTTCAPIFIREQQDFYKVMTGFMKSGDQPCMLGATTDYIDNDCPIQKGVLRRLRFLLLRGDQWRSEGGGVPRAALAEGRHFDDK